MEEPIKKIVRQEPRRRKERPFHGCIKGSARFISLGPWAQNLGPQSPLARPGGAVVTTKWQSVMGGHVGRVALLLQERRTTHAGTVATDAPCCELSHRKLKFWGGFASAALAVA